MTDFVKDVGLLVVGLLTAVFIYPFIHELGHAAVALMVGADIEQFALSYPQHIICDISHIDSVSRAAIGIGGNVFPYFISSLWQPKNFWAWYVLLLIKVISLLSLALSIISIILYQNGSFDSNEDINQVLAYFTNGDKLCLIVFSLMFIFGIKRIASSRPLKRCLLYFGV